MSVRCIFVSVLLIKFTGLLTAQQTYDCRRLNDCANNGTCDHVEDSPTFKKCLCSPGYQGVTCGFRTVDICQSNICKHNGTCYGSNNCSCPYGYYGDTCELDIVDIKCSGAVNITMVFPAVYSGIVYLDGHQTDCPFQSVPQGGVTKFSISLPLNNTGCGANVAITRNDTAGYTEYQVKVVVQYSQMYLSAVDEIHTLNCRMNNNASTLYSDLVGQAVDIAGNLTKSVKDKEYTPVEMVVEDDAKSTLKPGTKLYVGQPFVLYFKLTDKSVYNSMRIERCEANNTLPGTADNKQYLILEFGCGTAKGSKVIRALQTSRNDTNGLPGAELKLRAFKFIDSENVGFVCSVKLCKAGDEASCAVRNQSDCSGITAGRRKRATADSPADSGQDKTMTTVISVYDPREYGALENQGTEPSAEQCLAKSDILAAFIVLVVAVVILTIACFIFVCICLRRRSHMKEYDSSILSTGSSEFRIPRAHVNSGFTTM